MASRDYLRHLVNDTLIDNATIGDEIFRPTEDRLYKRLAIGGTDVKWTEIPHIADDGNLKIGELITADATTGKITTPSLALSSTVLGNSINLGNLEYDGNFLYATADDISGRGFLATRQIFRLAANGATQGPAIFDFYGTGSSINLKESSIYRIEFHAYFTKVTTNASVTWTLSTPSAPFLVALSATGIPIGAATLATLSGASTNSTTTATNASANLGAAANYYYIIDATVHTVGATTATLRLTQGNGTAQPLAGSFYTVTRIPTSSVGVFS